MANYLEAKIIIDDKKEFISLEQQDQEKALETFNENIINFQIVK